MKAKKDRGGPQKFISSRTAFFFNKCRCQWSLPITEEVAQTAVIEKYTNSICSN